MTLSKQFLDRAAELYSSQLRRSKERRGPSGKITRVGYVLPFDREQFTNWLVTQFPGGIRRCICTKPIDVFNCQVDHVTPLERQGSPALSNLECICESCNKIKHTMTGEEFRKLLEFIKEMGSRFPDGQAVKSITHRLQSYSSLKASANGQRARKVKAKAAVSGNHSPRTVQDSYDDF